MVFVVVVAFKLAADRADFAFLGIRRRPPLGFLIDGGEGIEHPFSRYCEFHLHTATLLSQAWNATEMSSGAIVTAINSNGRSSTAYNSPRVIRFISDAWAVAITSSSNCVWVATLR